MQATILAMTVVLAASHFMACGILFAHEGFSVSRWKAAGKDERRRMAPDFLKKYSTKGMSLDQLKDLLGEPDYEHDTWSYNLSLKGAPPPGPQTIRTFLEYPELYVHFKEGRVEKLSVTHGLQMSEESNFDAELWNAGGPSERFKLAASLTNSDLLNGRRKNEVEQLLGAPDGQSKSHEIEYDLGIRMIDMVTLTFTLDPASRVSDGRIVEH